MSWCPWTAPVVTVLLVVVGQVLQQAPVWHASGRGVYAVVVHEDAVPSRNPSQCHHRER